MGEEIIVLRGWIRPCEGQPTDPAVIRTELSALGVEVGTWDLFQSEFQDCKVSIAALNRLDPLWGKYIWGLS